MCCLKYEQAAYEDAVKRMPKNDSFVLTPDGPGNVSAVNLVRETVSVRLDDSSEGQKSYHGCEIRVLRNGKGSREGIEIPAERPARFVKQDAESELDAVPSPVFRALELSEPDAPAMPETPAAEESGEKRERRRRGGRGRRGGRRTRRRGPHRSKAGGRRGRRQGKASRKERGKPPTRAASAADRPSAGRVRKSLLSPLPKGSPPRAARAKRARAAGIIAAAADAGAAAAEAAAEHRAQRRARNKVKKREPLFTAASVFSWDFRAERV